MVLIYWLFLVLLSVLVLPVMALVALLIILFDGWPPVFKQKRVGKNGQPFILYKFRTMKMGAERLQGKLRPVNEADGPVFKIRNDPRFTPLGKFLSHTGLDELPQLINVWRGEMALIGPRPLPPPEIAKLKPWQRGRQAIKPGIISPVVLTNDYHHSFDAWMKSDLAYVKSKNFWGDLRLFGKAVAVITKLLLTEATRLGES